MRLQFSQHCGGILRYLHWGESKVKLNLVILPLPCKTHLREEEREKSEGETP